MMTFIVIICCELSYYQIESILAKTWFVHGVNSHFSLNLAITSII
jgi:hypothetical protein